MDDILIHGRTQEEHDVRLHQTLKKIQAAGLTLNKDKCVFSKTSVKFLGQVIDSDGIRPDPDKIKAIHDVQEPQNVSDIRRFLGMVNQLSKFSPRISDKMRPLCELLSKNNQWCWGESQKMAFKEVKTMLTSSPVLALFDPSLATTVSADASSFGLGAVLLQTQKSGELRPIAYASRAMTPADVQYAQIEKEVLTLTWACEKFSDYLVGLKFHIFTDHKPLVPLLSTKRLDELPLRVQRFRLRLMRYYFTISHVPGKDMTIPDALSRAPSTEATLNDKGFQDEVNAYVNVVIKNLPASQHRIQQIRKHQEEDAVLRQVSKFCYGGWPDVKNIPNGIKLYHSVSSELSVEKGLLLHGSQIVIPHSLQAEIIAQVHRGHQGITKCRERARQCVWWPGLSAQLEEVVRRCRTCCKEQLQRSARATYGIFFT